MLRQIIVQWNESRIKKAKQKKILGSINGTKNLVFGVFVITSGLGTTQV